MRFLLDQGLPRSTIRHLAVAGVLADHVGELGVATASDADVLETARQQNAVVVSLDADFHHLLAVSQATFPSVVRIRSQGLRGEQLAAILLNVIAVASAELEAGSVVSVSRDKIRVRRLPIGKSSTRT